MPTDLNLEKLARIPDPFTSEGGSELPPIDVTTRSRSPTRAQRRRLRLVAVVVALLYEIAWVLVVERRADLASLPASSIALGLLIPLLVSAVAFGAVVRRGPSGLGPPAPRLVACVLFAPVLFFAGTWIVAPADLETNAGMFWGHVARCVAVTGLLAALPLALGAFAFRRAFVAASAWRTAALGIACGALAASTMSLVCSDAGASHVLVGHGATMVVGGAIGALLGRYVARG